MYQRARSGEGVFGTDSQLLLATVTLVGIVRFVGRPVDLAADRT